MYTLMTSTGFRTQTTTVEQVASALAGQLDGQKFRDVVRWMIITPRGSVLSDTVPVELSTAETEDDRANVASAHLDHAYALLVRDHLTQAKDAFSSGHFHPMSRVGTFADTDWD